jgi:hypothetical protein
MTICFVCGFVYYVRYRRNNITDQEYQMALRNNIMKPKETFCTTIDRNDNIVLGKSENADEERFIVIVQP